MEDIIKKLQSYWVPNLERCGYVDLQNNIFELENKHKNPKEGFEIEVIPDAAIALWHTHPSGCANLSTEDYYLFKNHPKLLHLIIGQQEVVIYFVDADGSVLRGEL